MDSMPSGWITNNLDSLLISLESGSRPKGGVRGIKDGVPSIGGEHLTYKGTFDFSSIKYVPKVFASRMNKGHVQKNDILIVKDGATTGKTAFVSDKFPFNNAVVNEHVFVCRPSPLVEPKFLFRYLMSIEGQERILGNFQGSAQGGINLSFAPNTEVPLAPLPEQRRILAKLEKLLVKVEVCQERLDKIPTLLKRFRQSVLASACTGRLTVDWREKHLQIESSSPKQDLADDLPESWRWEMIRDLASSAKGSIQSGPFGSSLLHSEFQSTGILAIGIDNVLEGKFSFGKQHRISQEKYDMLKKYTARPLDVLVTVMATVGRCCVLPADIETAIITKHVYRITVNQTIVNPYFLMHCIRGCPDVLAQVQDNIQGVTRPGINGTILKEIKIPFSPLPEQHEIVRRVEALFKIVDRIEERYQKAKAHINKLTQSILAKAFRGELVPQDPNDEPASILLERIRQERKTR